jgi:MFS family permease
MNPSQTPSNRAILILASLAMVATLPGRSQGIGLITEPLLADLRIDRVRFAEINLWTSLAGSLFALAFGHLLDRWGAWILAPLMATLGSVVVCFSTVSALPGLVFGLWLLRGLGQSALSAGSLSLIGIAARDRAPSVMAAYSILLSVGFMIAFPLIGTGVQLGGWRWAWAAVGGTVLMLGIVSWRLLRRSALIKQPALESLSLNSPDFTLPQALATPAFWVFGISSSIYGLVASGVGIFNQSILAELGFAPGIFVTCLGVTALTGLAGNFLGGWLLTRVPARLVMVTAMTLLAIGLTVLPQLRATWMVLLQACVMGLAGGLVTVLFFSYWPQTFGRRHLGSIQGAAQLMTVVASATGPLLLARIQEASGSYSLAFRGLGVATALLGLAALVVRPPRTPSLIVRPQQIHGS